MSENKIKVIDCFGDYCPVPILRIKEQLSKMRIGESFVLISDHSCVVTNARSTFSSEKIKLDVFEPMNGVWEITITKISE